MPHCFQLYPKGSETPKVLQEVDDEMRQHFGVAPDPEHWLGHWYDTIGFRLATGKSFDEIREEFRKRVEEEKQKGNLNHGVEFYTDLIQIADYLDQNYETNAYYTRNK